MESKSNKTVPGHMTNTVLTNLNPNTIYYIKAYSLNSIGMSDPTKAIQVKTGEDTPTGPPLKVTCQPLSESTLKISWEAPLLRERNGKLLGYHVRYGQIDGHSLMKKTVFITQINKREMLILKGLSAFSKYEVSINAYNSVGSGPSSTKCVTTTFEGLPTAPPKTINCVSDSPSTIKISWSPPSKFYRNGIIIGYTISYRLENKVIIYIERNILKAIFTRLERKLSFSQRERNMNK